MPSNTPFICRSESDESAQEFEQRSEEEVRFETGDWQSVMK